MGFGKMFCSMLVFTFILMGSARAITFIPDTSDIRVIESGILMDFHNHMYLTKDLDTSYMETEEGDITCVMTFEKLISEFILGKFMISKLSVISASFPDRTTPGRTMHETEASMTLRTVFKPLKTFKLQCVKRSPDNPNMTLADLKRVFELDNITFSDVRILTDPTSKSFAVKKKPDDSFLIEKSVRGCTFDYTCE